MTDRPKLRIRGLRKAFGANVVLDGLDYDIMPGESAVVIGGSGTGKSVLLKCILGLLHPDAGSIEVDGQETVGLRGRDLQQIRRKFGMLFQNAALFDSLPVWRNVAFGLIEVERMAPAKAKDVALENLAAVGLDSEVAELWPGELSGGMRKRVGLARAIATKPEILFFDEPTTGLDPIMGDVIDQLIVKSVKEVGATALSITHDMASARRISDHIAMLYGGRMIWTGPTARSTAAAMRSWSSSSRGAWKGRSRCRSRTTSVNEQSRARFLAKPSSRYVCQACGAVYGRWAGRCEACGEWNSIVEETAREAPPGGLGRGKKTGKPRSLDFAPLSGPTEPAVRRPSGIAEFDRVCGGGLVDGSAVLIGGDPGVGKSTVLLQVVARLAEAGQRCVYISGEEAIDQIRLRAGRLGLGGAPVEIAAATSVRDIIAALDTPKGPSGEAARVVVIDSIQTMFLDSLESAPGTVSQVRGSAQELIRLAKRRGFALLLVGHVTKEGVIAGPKVLEHMVDAVLSFEGDRGHQFRILRAVKNRFGPTDEIGVFEMTDAGMTEVPNPSLLFLADRDEPISGASVFAGLEGSRPVLVEIQALVAPSPWPRRAARSSAGTAHALPWSSRCSRPAAAWYSPDGTST